MNGNKDQPNTEHIEPIKDTNESSNNKVNQPTLNIKTNETKSAQPQIDITNNDTDQHYTHSQ